MLYSYLKWISFASVFYYVSFVLISCEQDFSVLNRTPPIQHDLDTTSHEFTWEIIEFPSPYGSASFYDVAIINENDIWAVGEIYADSAQPGVLYNAVHWNGHQWELKRIYFPTICGQSSLTSYPANSVFTFEDNQLWMSSFGDKIAVLKNNFQINQFCLPSSVSMSINKMWGSPDREIYVVGYQCNIAYSPDHGRSWQKLESPINLNGMDIRLLDISGNEDFVLTCGYNMMGYSVVLKIHNNAVSTLFSSRSFFPDPENNEYGQFSALKFFDNVCYIWSAAGLIQYHFPENQFTLTAVNRICSEDYHIVSLVGNSPNDILLVSSMGNIVHYNGVDWHTDNTVYNQFGADIFYTYGGADMKGNLVAIPGLCCGTEKAVVVVGRRDH